MPAKAWRQGAVVVSQLFAGVVLCAQTKLTLCATAQQGAAVQAQQVPVRDDDVAS